MYIWGSNTCLHCLRHHRDLIEQIWINNEFHNNNIMKLLKTKKIPFRQVEKNFLTHIARTRHHQNIVFKLKLPDNNDWSDFLHKVRSSARHPLVLLLDHITDPQNLGAILRTAYLLGVSGVVMARKNQSPITSAVINVSTGAALSVPIIKVPNLKVAMQKLKANNFWIYSTSLGRDAMPYYKVKFNSATVLVLGNEGKGVSPTVASAADYNIFIPMLKEGYSLNVSVASAILVEYIRNSLSMHI